MLAYETCLVVFFMRDDYGDHRMIIDDKILSFSTITIRTSNYKKQQQQNKKKEERERGRGMGVDICRQFSHKKEEE